MKKIVTMVLMTVLATALTAATIQPFKTSKFDQSAQGWGWKGWKVKSMAYSPETDKYASFYRQKNVKGTGTFGGLTGFYDDGNFENRPQTVLEQGQQGMNLRYPHVAEGPDGYFIGIGTNMKTDWKDSPLVFSIYNPKDGKWTVGTVLPTLFDQSFKDISFVKSGDEYIVVLLSNDGFGVANSKMRVITGKTKTPAVISSWAWEIKAAFPEKLSDNTTSRNEVIKIAPNGVGLIAFVDQDPSALTENEFFFYKWTKDFGATWSPAGEKEWATVDSKKILPYIGVDHYGEELIENSSIRASVDLAIDNNGNGFLMAEMVGLDSKGGFFQKSAEGTPTVGFYMTKFSWNGNGYNVEKANFMAQMNLFEGPEGAIVFPKVTETGRFAKFNNKVRFQIGQATAEDGKSVLYAGWTDRAYGCDVLTKTPIQGVTLAPDAQSEDEDFIADGYFTYSEDNGKTWASSNFKDANFWMAANVTNTSNPALATHEDAFTVAKKGKLVKNGNSYDLNVYAGYSIPDWGVRVVKETDNHCLYDYEANLYVGKIEVTGITNTAIEDGVVTASDFSLEQNYPNPFNPTTTINFNVDKAASVQLAVYNVQGQEIANLVNGNVGAGNHTVNFNGAGLNSGVYFYKLTVDGQATVKKMILNK